MSGFLPASTGFHSKVGTIYRSSFPRIAVPDHKIRALYLVRCPAPRKPIIGFINDFHSRYYDDKNN